MGQISTGISIEEVRAAMSAPLPGVAAQLDMLPQLAPPPTGDIPKRCKKGAVLLLLYPVGAEGVLHIPFTRRAQNLRNHRGQVSFPGGGQEKGETLRRAALRETQEELGVDPGAVEILGELTPLYISPSNYRIYPFVGYTPCRPRFRVNRSEVDALIEASLSLLLAPSSRQLEYRQHADFPNGRRVPFFRVSGEVVWGATAMVLSEFLHTLDRPSRPFTPAVHP